ncbi:lipoate--protein ligase family protein [Candidimonas sp. SYP-B2681]|uniref:lipoyl protein ligase domain-containing protein n=1 Tax=Candidimonas sp. SYP-B2681 TaxID=2497686 RepID=UPI000F8886A9|nr:lipoate--protein ligase family protein [Candidimonas sp. SYP-B2681]RTZ47511.1 lipoate--protein ligase family protein [Candidimonas sp. SYP-B2681]
MNCPPPADMGFRLLPVPGGLPQTAKFDEALIGLAALQGPTAAVWQATQGLVVPRTYQRFEAFPHACEVFARDGWPVTVRQSGGGIVPQGDGIINLSLAYVVEGKPLDHSDAAYLLICRIIAQALHRFGIDSHPQAVEGSFCDGRYNLAVGSGDFARKIAGTAQLWRRQSIGGGRDTAQVVLVHALILAAIDAPGVTARANRFEAMLGSTRHYAGHRIASLHDISAATRAYAPKAFALALQSALETELGAI